MNEPRPYRHWRATAMGIPVFELHGARFRGSDSESGWERDREYTQPTAYPPDASPVDDAFRPKVPTASDELEIGLGPDETPFPDEAQPNETLNEGIEPPSLDENADQPIDPYTEDDWPTPESGETPPSGEYTPGGAGGPES